MKKKTKKIEITFVCPKCNWINKPNEQSSKNWNVYNALCDKCGERCTIKVSE